MQKIGFITGGQLARMMLQALTSLRHDMHVSVLDSNQQCPCTGLVDEVVIGKSTDFDDVYHFGSRCDVIILEFEHVNVEALKRLQKQGVQVLCYPHDLEIIQDKGLQKQFLIDHDLPTAQFRLIENKSQLQAFSGDLPFVLKTRKHGYDGGGVQKLTAEADFEAAFDAPSLVEDCVDIEKEYSLIVGRDAFGTTFRYPVAEQFFHPTANLVQFIATPSELESRVEEQITRIGDGILAAFNEVGMWAVELFLSTSGEVLVNEIAPRVHNSGHQTIEGNQTSQFAQFVRLALGHPCGSTQQIQPAVTMNLLGPEEKSGPYCYEGLETILRIEGVFPHFYGKATSKPFRKLGHVTAVAESLIECWQKLESVEQDLRIVVQ